VLSGGRLQESVSGRLQSPLSMPPPVHPLFTRTKNY